MLRKYGIRRLKTADSIWLSPYIILYLYFVIKADTRSLAEAVPPQPQNNVAMKRALLFLRMLTMKVSIGLPFPQQKKHICLFAQMLLQPKYRTGVCCRTGQNKPTRSVTILYQERSLTRGLYSVVLCIPGIYICTTVSFGLGPARSRNNKHEWVFLGKNHTDDSRWCNGIYDLPACFRKPWPTSWKQSNIANKYQGRRKKEQSVGSVSGNGTPIVFRP